MVVIDLYRGCLASALASALVLALASALEESAPLRYAASLDLQLQLLLCLLGRRLLR